VAPEQRASRVISLDGLTVGITESRRATELARLVTNLGGVPVSAPAVREIPCRDRGPALDVLARIVRREVAFVVFLTGVGTAAFLELAAVAGLRESLLVALGEAVVVARGPKPIAVLKGAGVRIDVVPDEPTSEGLLRALAAHDVRARAVAVQRYGEDNPVLVEGLAARGATVLEVPLYEWALPEDQEPLARLIRAVIARRVDVVAFTSSPQIRHLFAVAERLGLGSDLAASLREVPIAVVGPVCEAALTERGLRPRIQPAKGTMGALVHSIAEHFAAAS
jgi:uroporphyrinogen-III synthase